LFVGPLRDGVVTLDLRHHPV